MTAWLDRAGITEQEARRDALLLHTVLVLAFVLNLVSFVLLSTFGTNMVANVGAHLVAGSAEGLGVLAVRRGHVRPTARVVITVLMTLMISVSFFFGGLLGTVPYVAIAIMVMAYYLLGVGSGDRAAAALLISAVLMVVFAQTLPPLPEATAAGNLPSFVVTLGLTAVVVRAAIVRSERYAEEAQAALDELRAAESRTSQVFDTMREALLVIDGKRRVVRVNGAAEKLFGRSEAELLGTFFDELLHGTGQTDLPTFSGVERVELEIRSNATSAPVPVMLSMSWGATGVHKDHMVAVLSDVTPLKIAQLAEARAARVAEEASRTKSQFLANMSHELRTPLNAILGYSEMLQEEIDDDDQLDDLGRIHRAGKHLLGLINDVLDLSKIEAGRMELVRERVDIGQLIQDAVDTSQALAAQSRATVISQLDDDLGTVWTDSQRMRQILLNLLSNACKFSERGQVEVRAERVAGKGSDQLRIAVADTGIGMSADQLEKLFQPFTQADASTSRKYGGTGLGLVLSRRFTEMLGGELEVQSALGEGTTVTLTFPVEPAAPARAPAEPVPASARPTVLCIDDDPAVSDLLSRMLGGAGFRALVASSGEEGLELAKRERPAAITLDILLPGMDGWAVLAQLKDDPDLAGIPVVIVTMVDEERRGFVMGATDYLVKPIARGRLLSAVSDTAGGRTGTALVVEDDPDTRSVLVRRLQDIGWTVLAAEHGRDALDQLAAAESLPDVILLDIMMPVMDGFEVAEQLRQDERYAQIPVLVLTALDLTTQDRSRLGVEETLSKSEVELGDVVAEVRRLAGQERRGAPL